MQASFHLRHQSSSSIRLAKHHSVLGNLPYGGDTSRIVRKSMAPEISPVDGDLVDLLNKTFTGQHRRGWIKVEGCTLPEYYQKFSDAVENFEVHDDDVWVCSFPKSGTTWTQEMAWSIVNGLDSKLINMSLEKRFPFFELSSLFDTTDTIRRNPNMEIPETFENSISYVEKLPRPRFIKTHLPFNLLPRQIRTKERNPKMMYVCRNPKDACISFYHHSLLLEGFQGDFDDYINLFLGDRVPYAPFWKHILGYWNERKNDNLLFLKYQDMKKDLPSVIKEAATFLGEKLTSDQVSALNEHLSFANMKANSAVNHEHVVPLLQNVTGVKREGVFMRSGTTGQWKKEMTPEVIKRFDDWTRENLEDTDLSF